MQFLFNYNAALCRCCFVEQKSKKKNLRKPLQVVAAFHWSLTAFKVHINLCFGHKIFFRGLVWQTRCAAVCLVRNQGGEEDKNVCAHRISQQKKHHRNMFCDESIESAEQNCLANRIIKCLKNRILAMDSRCIYVVCIIQIFRKLVYIKAGCILRSKWSIWKRSPVKWPHFKYYTKYKSYKRKNSN